MAFFHVNFFSTILCFNTDVNVIIPTQEPDETAERDREEYFPKDTKYQTLYLLHGAYGDYSDWARYTGIERYAKKHNLAVVMPSAANSFYEDMVYGSDYLSFLTKELPMAMEKMFPLSTKREERFIAGLSMGGYGALKIALKEPERFVACASLSGTLDIAETIRQSKMGKMPILFRWEERFERPEQVEGTRADIFALLEEAKNRGKSLPKLFLSCGREDYLHDINKKFSERLKEMGIEHTYEEHDGKHDWGYWDTHIQRVLAWLDWNDLQEEK